MQIKKGETQLLQFKRISCDHGFFYNNFRYTHRDCIFCFVFVDLIKRLKG